MDEARAVRAARRARRGARRRAAARVQDARARVADPRAARAGVERAVDDDAVRVFGDAPVSRPVVGFSVVPVPAARIPARQQERADAAAACAPARDPRRSARDARSAVVLRRSRAPARAARFPDRAGAARARLDAADAPRRNRRGRVARGLSSPAAALGAVRDGRGTRRSRGRVPSVALPSRDDRRAHHRLQAGHRRHERRAVSAQDARRRAVPRALARAHHAVAHARLTRPARRDDERAASYARGKAGAGGQTTLDAFLRHRGAPVQPLRHAAAICAAAPV
ncbi:hypothetical protein BVI2075_10029 [Burkholderia vietnamiensis]|nr:hypothetical protein BVI2075_10029 [Burkholderia vietnamiensis]